MARARLRTDLAWQAFDKDGLLVATYWTAPAAMKRLNREHPRWWLRIQHRGTGERWERLRGAWFKTQETWNG